MSNQDGTYIQFPLSHLAIGKRCDAVTQEEKNDRVAKIISTGINSFAQTIDMDSEDFYWEKAARLAKDTGFNADVDLDARLLIAADILGITPGARANLVGRNLLGHLNYGTMQTRIAKSLIFEYRDEHQKTWREFAVLSAMYAGVGGRNMQRLSYDHIRTMASGFNGQAQFKDCWKRLADPRLSVDKVRTTVSNIVKRGFFRRVCPNRRHVYYSCRLTQEQLENAVVERVVAKEVKRRQSISDQSVEHKIKQRLAEAGL